MKSLVTALLLWLAFATAANAGIYVVNTEQDFAHAALNEMPSLMGPFNLCEALFIGSGVCSLRAAVQAANANPGSDTIMFNVLAFPQTYTLSIPGANEDAARQADLDVFCSILGDCSTETLTIIGNGETDTMINGGAIDRVFDVIDADIELVIQNLTIENGNTTMPTPADGSAVRNNGTLTLDNVTVRDSVSHFTIDGGSLLVATAHGAVLNIGTMTLTDVQLIDNIGDGLHAGAGTVTATNLHASGNSVAAVRTVDADAIAKIQAGSVLTANSLGFWTSAGRLMLTDCTLSLNTQTIPNGTNPSGGGFNEGGFATINRCDITGNSSTIGGAGLFNRSTLELVDSRVADNVLAGGADSGAGLLNGLGRAVVRRTLFTNNTSAFGAAIFNVATLTLVNSTVSGNVGPGISTRDDSPSGSKAELRVFSSTVVQNSPYDLNQLAETELIEVRSSIVELCDVTAGTPNIVSLGFNFERLASCGSGFTAVADLIGGTIDSNLALNGGTTETHALVDPATTTTAKNVDTSPSCPLTDQRGFSRPLERDPMDTTDGCDAGAYEIGDTFQCNDGLDNDIDGQIDLADSGCLNATDNRELTIADGQIFVASDGAAGVFAIPAGYVNPGPGAPPPPLLTRGSGLVGPYSVRGRGTGDGIEDPNLDGQPDGIEIVIADALQGLLFRVDLETGQPWILGSSGGLDFPRDLEFASDGDVFAVGSSDVNEPIVRVDPLTGSVTDVTHPAVGAELALDNPLGAEWDPDAGALLVSQFSGTAGPGIFRVDPVTGDVTSVDMGVLVTDPRGLFRRRTGDLLAVNRASGSNDDVIEVDLGDGSETALGVNPALTSPRGIGLIDETEQDNMGVPEVLIQTIVSERSIGVLHQVEWLGAAPPTTTNFAEDLPKMYHVWILHDRDADGLLDDQDDSDSDGLTDDFETNTGLAIDADHPGSDPNNPDSDADGLSDFAEATVHGTNPNNRDSDGDGASDPLEIASGTDPNDPASVAPLPALSVPALAVLVALLAASAVFWRRELLHAD